MRTTWKSLGGEKIYFTWQKPGFTRLREILNFVMNKNSLQLQHSQALLWSSGWNLQNHRTSIKCITVHYHAVYASFQVETLAWQFVIKF